MKENLMLFFTFFGIISSVIVLVTIIMFIIMAAYYFITEKIEELKYDYKAKHRFDKPPLANCYCIDCKSYNRKNERCYRLNRGTADNWFCWSAERKRVENEQEKA
nr:MAG TPA: hypothetical protein [Caudoviricetes sp.]